MIAAVNASDASFDGVFFTAVKTTRIFCRPSCRAKKPLEKNMLFFATASEALAEGFRACKLCHPLRTESGEPAWVKQLLGELERNPTRRITDDDLRAMQIEPSRARRYFNEQFGMTFHAYARKKQMARAHLQIQRNGDLDDVALGNGYDSHSGFREGFKKVIGAAPGKSRNKMTIVTKLIHTPLGRIQLGATPEGLCLAEFAEEGRVEGEIADLQVLLDCAVVPGTNEHLLAAEQQLAEYFEGRRKTFEIPLVTPGTAFETQVWRALQEIPYGQTISYLELARRIHNPKAVRAVGSANGRNRIPIIIPCHRVVNHNGQLGGYGGGLWRKKRLLELEGSAIVADQNSELVF